MNGSTRIAFQRVGGWLATAEKWIIVGMMLLLIGFALLQIVLRDFLSTGLVWGDALMRHLVLWIGFLGAARACAEGKHIHIEILPMILPAGVMRRIGLVRDILVVFVTVVLFYASVIFIQNESVSGESVLPGIPTWKLELIFPISFAIMSFRLCLRVVADWKSAIGEQAS